MGGLEAKQSKRAEIKDPLEIKKRVEQAKVLFSKFLAVKISKSLNVSFEIEFDNMLMNMGISDIPREIALQTMKKLIEATPGLVITEKGYAVSDSELLVKHFTPDSVRANMLRLFTEAPDKEFTSRDIAESLGLSRSLVSSTLNYFETTGKIYIARTEKAKSSPKGGAPAGIYKLVTQD